MQIFNKIALEERKKFIVLRPLDEVYPVVFVDATYFYLKDTGSSGKKVVYIILGINSNGYKDVLGFYVGESESAKY